MHMLNNVYERIYQTYLWLPKMILHRPTLSSGSTTSERRMRNLCPDCKQQLRIWKMLLSARMVNSEMWLCQQKTTSDLAFFALCAFRQTERLLLSLWRSQSLTKTFSLNQMCLKSLILHQLAIAFRANRSLLWLHCRRRRRRHRLYSQDLIVEQLQSLHHHCLVLQSVLQNLLRQTSAHQSYKPMVHLLHHHFHQQSELIFVLHHPYQALCPPLLLEVDYSSVELRSGRNERQEWNPSAQWSHSTGHGYRFKTAGST